MEAGFGGLVIDGQANSPELIGSRIDSFTPFHKRLSSHLSISLCALTSTDNVLGPKSTLHPSEHLAPDFFGLRTPGGARVLCLRCRLVSIGCQLVPWRESPCCSRLSSDRGRTTGPCC
ncbi:hypothetical protein JTE90_011421 [Oedothorax gibbosus]|uniref:Uncharacterized protein n=1 Tax=Oedothorax gibbosus TaxID=931172 RepID=A0AAV6VDR5_9ARAC|nr:hypothetical protein JTE90_011421 [Oedothorax gibbosus]